MGDGMKHSLKQSTKDKFDAIELSPGQLSTLQAQIDAASPPSEKRLLRFHWPAWALAPAALVLAIGLLLANQLYRANNANDMLQAIAMEVASNHLKLKPLEVESQNLREVLRYFDRLDFQLAASPSITGSEGDKLLGGRYCSIQGIDAAQLRVVSADGELSTWYEAMLPPGKLKHIPDIAAPAEFSVKGLRVRIWRDHGVVFAHARRAAAG